MNNITQLDELKCCNQAIKLLRRWHWKLRPDFGVHPWTAGEVATRFAKRANETISREKNYWLCNQIVCKSVILSCSFHEALRQTRQRREHFAIGRKAQRPHDKQFFFVCLSSWEYKALKTNHKRAKKSELGKIFSISSQLHVALAASAEGWQALRHFLRNCDAWKSLGRVRIASDLLKPRSVDFIEPSRSL